MVEINDQEWETECPNRNDNIHCDCWYDGEACCACEDTPAVDESDCNCDDYTD